MCLQIQSPPISERMNISVEVTNDGQAVYKSQLIVDPVIWSDTGHFVCQYEDHTADETLQAVIDVYVYGECQILLICNSIHCS